MRWWPRLRHEAARQGMSDQELGRRIGVGKNTIGRLMNGEVAVRMDRLFDIAKALGVFPEDLIRLARLTQNGRRGV